MEDAYELLSFVQGFDSFGLSPASSLDDIYQAYQAPLASTLIYPHPRLTWLALAPSSKLNMTGTVPDMAP